MLRLAITPVRNTSLLALYAEPVPGHAVALRFGSAVVRIDADDLRKLATLADPPPCPCCGEPQQVDDDGAPWCLTCPLVASFAA